MLTTKSLEAFNSLSEQKKIIKLERALKILQKTGQTQIKLLNKFAKSKIEKEIGFAYFLPTVEHTWENVDFAIYLGKSKYRSFNVYPTRVVFENVFRLEHYINQKKAGQNDICFWEIARLLKRYFDEFGDEKYRVMYEGMIKEIGSERGGYPSIEEKDAYRGPFPRMETLIKNTKFKTTLKIYTHYRFLSESVHSKLISIYVKENEIAQYRRNLFYLFLLCHWLLLLTDAHIKKATAKEVKQAITESYSVLFPI